MSDTEPEIQQASYSKQYARDVLGADCDNCPLRKNGKFVPSSGPAQSELAFVGEGPGVQEAREGVPFIGPSGRLLKLVLDKHGIDKDQTFLTNASLCRPIDGSTPPKSAVHACRPRLLRELNERGARTVVALGNSAANGVLGIEGITKLRVGPGRASKFPELDGARIIPTVHPAACLRQSDMFPSLLTDIGKVVNPPKQWTEPVIDVYDDEETALFILHQIKELETEVVVDIEVDIEKDTAFDHPDRYGLLCVGLAWMSGHGIVIGENALKSEKVLDALYDTLAASRIIAQNGKFDLAGLYPTLGVLKLFFDTMLASYILDERPGIHGLKFNAVELLGAPQYDEDIKKYVGPKDGYGVIPRDLLYKYNGYDVVCTYDLYELFSKRLDASNNPRAIKEFEALYPGLEFRSLRDVHDFLVEASNELMFMELNGIAVDKGYNAELFDKYGESLEKHRQELAGILNRTGFVGHNSKGQEIPFNPNSPKQVKEVLAHHRVRTESTDEDTLKRIKEQLETRELRTGSLSDKEQALYDFIEGMLLHRREAKLFGTYVKGIRKRLYRGRIYPTFLLHGTTSGRLASRNPNVQNIPRQSSIKQQFIPAQPENCFVQADYSQAELRILTWLAEDPYFRAILNDPERDIFDELTPVLYPELPGKMDVPEALWKETRIRVKAFVYGLGYGRTEYSIATEYKLSVEEAKAVKMRFFNAIPAIVNWQNWVKKRVYSGKDLISPFGRHRRFHLITQDNWKSIQNEALSFLPQSTSSDVCLRAMVRARRELRGSGAYIRNIVHDSILVDTPRDMANDVATMLDRLMVGSAQELVGDYVAFKTDVKIGEHWGEV